MQRDRRKHAILRKQERFTHRKYHRKCRLWSSILQQIVSQITTFTFHFRMFIQIPAIPLQIFLLRDWRHTDDGPSIGVSVTHGGDLNGVSGSWVWPSLYLSCNHLDNEQQMNVLSLAPHHASLSLYI